MTTRPHAFVAMPFGLKPGPEGTPLDFNKVYRDLIAPAVEAAGMAPFRADEEMRAGDIKTDMLQELLVADLVVVDLTIDNPNVWYELGVRHALRARGVVLVCGGRATTAFDVYTDRKLRYGFRDGAPDPETLEADKARLADMIRATMDSWHGRRISPVYQLLPNLREPDWRTLRIGDVREFWEQHDAWESRIELARKANHIGDILVLADEAPVAAFRATAWIQAGQALRKAGRFKFAVEQLERGLAVEPTNLTGLREKGICLQRLALAGEAGHSLDRARDHYRTVLKSNPNDPETWALLGRVDKDAWTSAWRRPGASPESLRENANEETALLCQAIENYLRGYRADLSHYFSGINALTLMHIHHHLTGDDRFASPMRSLGGAVRLAAEGERDESQVFWSKGTLADLEVLEGTPASVRSAYKDAVARNDKDWFALDSSRAQLVLLRDLEFRPDCVAAGIKELDSALKRLRPPEHEWQPRQVFLFSGHTMDAPDRKEARFPLQKEEAAAKRLAEALEQLGAGPEDVAYCQGAAGGDLLFFEACQRLGVRCRMLLPFAEAEFIERSVLPSAAGEKWRDRFYATKDRCEVREAPTELGPDPEDTDPFERCNLWLLYSALACGMDKVRFVCLWNGAAGDGRGGTEHMYSEVKRRTGRVTWIDTRTL